MDQGGEDGRSAPERWTFVTLGDGTVELLIPDSDEDSYADGIAAAKDLYVGWVIVDQGSYGENGEYVTLAIEENE